MAVLPRVEVLVASREEWRDWLQEHAADESLAAEPVAARAVERDPHTGPVPESAWAADTTARAWAALRSSTPSARTASTAA